MKNLIAITFLLGISLQPLYCETLSEENGYVNNSMAKTTYFAGSSSIQEEKLVRKPASLEKKEFYQRFFESKEDRFGYIFQRNY
jgi:hypothetical protein